MIPAQKAKSIEIKNMNKNLTQDQEEILYACPVNVITMIYLFRKSMNTNK